MLTGIGIQFSCVLSFAHQNFLVKSMCYVIHEDRYISLYAITGTIFSIDLMNFEWILNVFYTKMVDLKCKLYQKGMFYVKLFEYVWFSGLAFI